MILIWVRNRFFHTSAFMSTFYLTKQQFPGVLKKSKQCRKIRLPKNLGTRSPGLNIALNLLLNPGIIESRLSVQANT